MKKIKVLIADDHPVVREGLRASLKQVPHIQIVGEAADGLEAVSLAKRWSPHVVLMDISMPNLNGLEAAQRILKLDPKPKVIILSMHQYKAYILETIHSGAKGYLLKDTSPPELVRAIEAVHRGEVFFSSSVSQIVLNDYIDKTKGIAKASHPPEISNREAEVLSLVARGLSNKEIARELFLSIRTVETHREHIMKKLDIHSTAGLTRYAVAKGLVPAKENLSEPAEPLE